MNINNTGTGHILELKASLNKMTKIEINQSISSDYRRNNLEINNRHITRNSSSIWKYSKTLLNNQWLKEQIIMEIIKYFALKDKKRNTTQFMVCN